MPRVLVLGSINMDIVAGVDRHPVPGETLSGRTLSYFPGGKGANQAVAASRAGAPVQMLGAIGDDSFGVELLGFLQANAIDIAGVARRAGHPTGTALVLVADDGENEIVVIPGANGTVDDDIVAKGAASGDDVLVAQYETPTGSTRSFFDMGRDVGATCLLNPAPGGPIADELLATVDVLVVNEIELACTVGAEPQPMPNTKDVLGARESLCARGFDGAIVVTLGARGSVAVGDDFVSEVRGLRVNAIDTTGAGDCFVGYLASELALGRDLREGIVTSNAAAALCVQRAGAGPAMPTRAEIEGLLRVRGE